MSVVTLRSDAIHDAAIAGSGSLPVKFAKIDAGSSADLVAAVSGKRIRVLSLSLRLASSNTAKFQSGGSTDLTGAMTLTFLDWAFNPCGHLQTAASEKLNLVLGGAVQASGCLTYCEV